MEPGFEVTLSPEEAEALGLCFEDAISYHDAKDASAEVTEAQDHGRE